MTGSFTRHVVWVTQRDGWRLVARPRSARRARSLIIHWTRRGHDVLVETLRDHPRRGPVDARSAYRPGRRRTVRRG